MALATLTSKGQLTIPKEIREALKLKAGDKIEVILKKDREAVLRPVSTGIDDLFGRLHKPGRPAVSVKDMDAAIKKRLRDQYK
jgi:AbrB family looped-hinge helix DNA binding protein